MNSPVSVRQVVNLLEAWAPIHYAYDWDNVGLQVGSYDQVVTKVMITLDVTEAVIEEAIQNESNLIIAHHPLLFKAINQIDTEQPIGRMIQKIVKHNITVYAAHTNLDITNGGINDMLSDQLALLDREIMLPIEKNGDQVGLGIVGKLKETMDLATFAQFVKEQMSVPSLRVIGDLTRKVKKVAIIGGSGEKYLEQAKLMGADVYVTGDVTFHQAQDADALGLAIIDPGHHVEKVMITAVSSYLDHAFKKHQLQVETIRSQVNTEPFIFL